jgi:glycine cleavage system transcriptional repressor
MAAIRVVYSLVGPDRTGIVDRFSAVVSQHKANLEDARMSVLGGEFAVIMLVTVDEGLHDAVESDMRKVAAELDMLILVKQTSGRRSFPNRPVLRVHVIGMDHEGIVNPLVASLAEHGCSITSLESRVSMAPHTGAPLFEMEIVSEAPEAISLSELESRLRSLADALNVDVVIRSEGVDAASRK